VRGSAKRDTLVFVAYAAVSFAYFGWRLLPHPGRALIGSGADPFIFAWSFAWWPHALETGTNPFITHVVYAPQGIDLAWTASAPGLALAFAPLTLLFGPVVSVDVAAILLPALAAWTAYRLCRHLTGSTWASLVGGYLFGFSSFVLGQQLLAHLHLTGMFLLPVVALVVVRFFEGELAGRGLIWRLALLIAAELSISTELTLTMTLALAAGLALVALFVPRTRRRARAILAPALAAYAIAAVIAAPLVFYLLDGFSGSSFAGAENSSTDLTNFLLPSSVNAFLGSSFQSVTRHYHLSEAGAYLGLPTLLIVVLYAWRQRSSGIARFLVTGLLLASFVTLGDVLYVDGHKVVTLPWTLARHVPGLDNVRPTRFAVYVSLLAAVIVASWIATTKGRIYRRPFVLPVLAVAALVPAVWHADYREFPAHWAFFTNAGDHRCVAPGDTLLAFPWSSAGPFMLAQAEDGFRFRLAGGYLVPVALGAAPVSPFLADPTVQALEFSSDEAEPTMARLLAFAATHDVVRVLADPAGGYPSARQLHAFGPVQSSGGLLVAPGCGRPSLTHRNLTAYVTAAQQDETEDKTTGWCLGTNYYALPDGLVPAGILAGAHHADVIAGEGLGCSPPAGFTRQGFATAAMGFRPNTYPYYAVRRARPRAGVAPTR
jgi:hypothetical protein